MPENVLYPGTLEAARFFFILLMALLPLLVTIIWLYALN